MKAIFRLAAFVVAISMVALSCAKIEQPTAPVDTESEIEEPADGDFIVTFECSLPEGEKEDGTKTSFNEDQSKISWEEGDRIRFFQYAYVEKDKSENQVNDYYISYSVRTVTSSNTPSGQTTTFGVNNFANPTISTNQKGYYYSIYPADKYKSSDFENNNKIWSCVELPNDQTPKTLSSYDPMADLLISELKEVETKQSNIRLRYTHVVAFGKMTIKNLPSSQPVKTIEFSAKKGVNDVPVAGARYYNINEGVADEQKTDNKCSEEHKITLNYTSNDAIASNNGFTAYFCCYPFELGAGDSFKVVVTTTAGEIFTKDVPLQDKSLAFNQSKGSKFTVDMSNATKTCSWFEISESKASDNITISQIKTQFGRPNGSKTKINSIFYTLLKSSDYVSNTDYFQQEGSYKIANADVITGINNGVKYITTYSSLDIDTEYTILYKVTNEDEQSVILKRTARTDWFNSRTDNLPTEGKFHVYFAGHDVESVKHGWVLASTFKNSDYSTPEEYFDKVLSGGTSYNVINKTNEYSSTKKEAGPYAPSTTLDAGEYIYMVRATKTGGSKKFISSEFIVK